MPGVAFTFAIAALGYAIALLPAAGVLGRMVTAILIAVLIRQIWGYPQKLKTGIQFSAKTILRLAIILFGFNLQIAVFWQQGLGFLLKDMFSVLIGILITLFIARLLKVDHTMALLLGVGTGVCGAAAIAAVSPILRSKDEETAISAAMIALTGTVFTIVYTLIRPLLSWSDLQYGAWAGLSLHELAHVAAAAAPAGEDALAFALMAKLGRVLLLVPVCFLLLLWAKRNSRYSGKTNVPFPWFLLGFVLSSMLGSFVSLDERILNFLSQTSSFLLTSAMVGLGLNIQLQSLRKTGMKPMAAIVAASVILAASAMLMV